MFVEEFGEGLEIDVGGVEAFEDRFSSDVGDVSGGDSDGLDTVFVACGRGVDGVFGPDHRVVVGEGHAAAAGGQCGLGDGIGGGVFAEFFDFARLGDRPVLAELATEVATGGPEAEHRCAGQEVVEWFLFDRIDAEPGTLAVGGQHHFVADVLSDEAKTTVVVSEQAFPWAEFAKNLIALPTPPATGFQTVGSSGGRWQEYGVGHCCEDTRVSGGLSTFKDLSVPLATRSLATLSSPVCLDISPRVLQAIGQNQPGTGFVGMPAEVVSKSADCCCESSLFL